MIIEERAMKATKAIAQTRLVKNDFTIKELANSLKKEGCPYSVDMAYILKKKNLIVPGGRGTYHFVSSDPIYYKAIMNELDKASQKYIVKKNKSLKVSNSVTKISESDPIEMAIKLLKLQGYKILKPVFTEI